VIKKLFKLVIFGLLLGSLTPAIPAQAAANQQSGSGAFFGEVVCTPDLYISQSLDCIPAGPSQSIANIVSQGIPYPVLDLPASRPNQELANLPIAFAKINIENTTPAAIYGSLDDAVAGQNPTRFLQAGETVYVSYIQRTDVNGGHYVMLSSGEWMRASPGDYSRFSGLVFHSTPRNNFGWIIDQAIPRLGPGYAAPEMLKMYYRETQVQVYQQVEMDGTTWYQIGADEWVERRYIRQVMVNTTPPEGVTNGRWIEVNLYEQTLSVYDQNQLVFATLIATGAEPYFTQPGLHQIYQKKELETMTGAFEADKSDYYYLADVPWTMYFDGARALHGAYWRAVYGYPQSHGCVNLSIIDSHWLFDWAQNGDYVYVWDPSGATPTDPEFYSNVGAY
jgi:hypothetical protein